MMALAFSGGKDSMACLHLMRDQLNCAIYIDTGFTYPETDDMVAYAATMISVHRVTSDRQGQNDREGIPAEIVPINWTRQGQAIAGPQPVMLQSYLGCCWDNISAPLWDTVKRLGVTTLVTGQRKEDTYKAPIRSFGMFEGVTRLHPIEDWTTQQVLDYLRTKMEIPPHYALQHSSLDCYDCTGFSRESQDRIAWTKSTHPDKYVAYLARQRAMESVIQDASVLYRTRQE